MTWQVLDQVVDDRGIRRGAPTPGQTIAGTHASASYHYLGLARDYGMSDSDAVAISHLFAPLARSRPDLIPEMFGADGVGYSQGSPFQPAGHTGSHTHVAVAAGVTAQELESALGGANVAPATPGASTAGSAVGSLAFVGKTSTAIRLVEILVGSVLILMGLVALSKALKGASWATT
jgi:hypothetical protein